MGRGTQQFAFLPARSAAVQLFPAERGYALPPDADELMIEPDALRCIMRDVFRQTTASKSSAAADPVDLGLHALKIMHGQLAMRQHSSVVRTELDGGIAVLVEATSAYRGRDGPSYVFSYRIRLTNVGTVPVQLVARQWDIRNSDGTSHATVPRGSPGVVGQTPKLEPGGDSFEYASGTTLATSTGTVEGSLQMMSLGGGDDGMDDGKGGPFDAIVGRFPCVCED